MGQLQGERDQGQSSPGWGPTVALTYTIYDCSSFYISIMILYIYIYTYTALFGVLVTKVIHAYFKKKIRNYR